VIFLVHFLGRPCDSTANGCKMTLHSTLCNFFLSHSLYKSLLFLKIAHRTRAEINTTRRFYMNYLHEEH